MRIRVRKTKLRYIAKKNTHNLCETTWQMEHTAPCVGQRKPLWVFIILRAPERSYVCLQILLHEEERQGRGR